MNWRCTLWGHRWGFPVAGGRIVTFTCQRERCWTTIFRSAPEVGGGIPAPDPRAESNVHRRGAH